jgi:hypothetical protein
VDMPDKHGRRAQVPRKRALVGKANLVAKPRINCSRKLFPGDQLFKKVLAKNFGAARSSRLGGCGHPSWGRYRHLIRRAAALAFPGCGPPAPEMIRNKSCVGELLKIAR